MVKKDKIPINRKNKGRIIIYKIRKINNQINKVMKRKQEEAIQVMLIIEIGIALQE